MQHKVAGDGRRARRARSRQAILDATYEIMEEGILAPTSQDIADRAGVDIRTLFRQFQGMDDLYAAANDSKRSLYDAMFAPKSCEGSFDERLLQAVEQHASGYEELRNAFLLTLNQRWRSPVLRENYAMENHRLRRGLELWLPELNSMPQSIREAVDAIASFEMWHRLREDQHLSIDAATKIIYDTLKRLTSEP